MPFNLRRATEADAQTIADVYFASFRLLNFLPTLHTIGDYRRFVADVVLKECAVTVVEDGRGIIAFLARRAKNCGNSRPGPIVSDAAPESKLIEAEKLSGVAALELWCFQANDRTALLRGARFPRDPLHGRRRQRGADARCPLSLGAAIAIDCFYHVAPCPGGLLTPSFSGKRREALADPRITPGVKDRRPSQRSPGESVRGGGRRVAPQFSELP
jgi:hypothetical protein